MPSPEEKWMASLGYTNLVLLGQGGFGMAFRSTAPDASLHVLKVRPSSFCGISYHMSKGVVAS